MKPVHAPIVAFVLMIIALLGLNLTDLTKFPDLGGVPGLRHFHGAMMLLWFILLILQPDLIRFKQNAAHRVILLRS